MTLNVSMKGGAVDMKAISPEETTEEEAAQ